MVSRSKMEALLIRMSIGACLRDGLPKDGLRLTGPGQIALHAPGRAARSPDLIAHDRGLPLGMVVMHDDMGPLRGERQDHSPAQALGRSGDKRRSAGERHIRVIHESIQFHCTIGIHFTSETRTNK